MHGRSTSARPRPAPTARRSTAAAVEVDGWKPAGELCNDWRRRRCSELLDAGRFHGGGFGLRQGRLPYGGRTATLHDAGTNDDVGRCNCCAGAGNRDSKLCFRDDLEEGGTELARGRELVVDGGEDGVGDDSEGDAGLSFFILKLKSKKQKNLSH